MLRKIIYIFIIFLMTIPAFGQQIPQFSQRSIDMYQYNPAVTGSRGYTEFMIHHRNQWKGFEGSPVTQSFTYQTRANRLMGLGFTIMKDEIGPAKTVGLRLAYAHHINLNTVNLAFGLSADILQYGIDGNLLTLKDPADNAISLEVDDKDWRPDAAFGTYLYNESFYFGFSMLNLLGSTIVLFDEDGREGHQDLVRHYYLNSGYNFSPIRNFDFEPSILWGFAKGTPSQLDINLNVQYMQMGMLGVSYRLKDALVIVGGVRVKGRLKLAYSYDIVTSSLRSYNSGSHEIIMSFIIPSKKGKFNRWRHEYRFDFDPKTHKWRERW